MSYSRKMSGHSFHSWIDGENGAERLCIEGMTIAEAELRAGIGAAFERTKTYWPSATREDFDFVVSRYLGDIQAIRDGDKYWFLTHNVAPLPQAIG